VYDVSSRESFDALPRWYSELETYVSSSVVKILVGNKVDKVNTHAHAPRSFLGTLLNSRVGVLPPGSDGGRQAVRDAYELAIHRGVGQDRRGRARGVPGGRGEDPGNARVVGARDAGQGEAGRGRGDARDN
jgi:Ras-related protein Rab-18